MCAPPNCATYSLRLNSNKTKPNIYDANISSPFNLLESLRSQQRKDRNYICKGMTAETLARINDIANIVGNNGLSLFQQTEFGPPPTSLYYHFQVKL